MSMFKCWLDNSNSAESSATDIWENDEESAAERYVSLFVSKSILDTIDESTGIIVNVKQKDSPTMKIRVTAHTKVYYSGSPIFEE